MCLLIYYIKARQSLVQYVMFAIMKTFVMFVYVCYTGNKLTIRCIFFATIILKHRYI